MNARLAGFVFLTLLFAAARPALAQQSQRCDTAQSIDRVVAVVGTAPILASYVDETAYQSIAQQGIRLPDSAGALRAYCHRVLNEIIDVELLVQEAQLDTAIKVTDQEVAEGVEQQVKNVRGKFVSEIEYRSELRKAGFESPDEYRRWLSDQQRREALKNRLLEKLQNDHKLEPVIPTDKEMRQAFEERKAELGDRPATVSIKQIVVTPKADSAALLRAYLLADSIARGLRKGGDFAVAAKRFSQDPTTKEQGGDLGWFRRGMMVTQFEQVAFSLKPGVVSNPVETIFGFHVIQVQRVQPGEIQARHILIMPEITQAEADSAQALGERIRTAVLNGASIDSLQRLYNDPTLDKDASDVSLTRLPPEYQTAIGQLDSGAVVPLFKLPGPVSYRDKYIILKLMNRRSAGEVKYEDVRDQIRTGLSKDLAVQHYVARLRKNSYVEIRGF